MSTAATTLREAHADALYIALVEHGGDDPDWFRFVTDWPRPVFDRAVADLVKQGRAVLEAAAFMVCLLPVLPADTTDVDA